MKIGGFQKFSLLDYPGKISAIVFTQGCNFCCPYCHNPELLPSGRECQVSQGEILEFLESRKGRLDAVVITGGEPTLQPDLLDFISQIKKLGYFVKLDTNGSNPKVLREIFEHKLVDYVAMDIKSPLDQYKIYTCNKDYSESIKASVKLIIESAISHEFRTTVVRSLLSEEDLCEIAKMLKGTKNYIMQKFVPSKVLDARFLKADTYTDEEFEKIKKFMVSEVPSCSFR